MDWHRVRTLNRANVAVIVARRRPLPRSKASAVAGAKSTPTGRRELSRPRPNWEKAISAEKRQVLSLEELIRSLGTLPDTLSKSTFVKKGVKRGPSSSTGSSSESVVRGGKIQRQRNLRRRVKRRLDAHLDAAIAAKALGSTLLEERAVTEQVTKQYNEELRQFMRSANITDLRTVPENEMDEKLAVFFELSFFTGHQPNRGSKLIAALMHRLPDYGRNGNKKLPRAWRALRGWKRLVPGRSRRPEPLRVWAGIANGLAARGQYAMGMFVLLSVTTYLRPSSLLSLRRVYLVAPSGRGSNYWTLLAHPREEMSPSKTGEYDLSIPLDSPWLQELIPAIQQMKQGDPRE